MIIKGKIIKRVIIKGGDNKGGDNKGVVRGSERVGPLPSRD